MIKYIAILKDKERGALTPELLQNHVEHLKSLKNKGVLFLCGPFKDNDGAMQILQVNSYEEAESYVLLDPFIKYKYYSSYIIHELFEANEGNNYLMDDTQTKTNIES